MARVAKPKAKAHPALVLKERQHLIKLLTDPVFVKAMEIAAGKKPGAFCGGIGVQVENAETSVQVANNRLHEIRGWEMFEHALYMQTADPKPERTKVEETYPDQGRIDNEW